MKVVKKIGFILLIVLGILLSIIIIDYVRINIRYFINKNKYESSFKIYGNKNGYVPQGLTYVDKYNVVLQTSYSNDVSKLFVIDFESGKLLKELKLINGDGSKNTKHVGGIATNGNYVWISNDYEVDIYYLDDIYKSDETIKPINEIKLPIRGDFCYYKDNILWIGDFYLKPFYNVPNGDPKLYGYNVSDNIDYNQPNYSISLPKAVQGMSILPNGNFVFTESFTYLINSNLVMYDNILDNDYNKFDDSNKLKTIKLPPMAEGMFYKDGYLYILFESSSSKYFLASPKIYNVLKYKVDYNIK